MADFRVGECTKWVGASHKQSQKVGMYFKTDINFKVGIYPVTQKTTIKLPISKAGKISTGT